VPKRNGEAGKRENEKEIQIPLGSPELSISSPKAYHNSLRHLQSERNII